MCDTSDNTAWAALAHAMFPHIDRTPADYEALYPPRRLPDGAKVTRIAPSPTGYLHIGTFFTATIDRLTAGGDGVFYFRLEDTDKKREVEGGAEDILAGMNAFGLTIDEGYIAPDTVVGDYGPYQQSQRATIYQAYVKQLVAQGLAYPCFCTEEQRQATRERQEAGKERTGYYGAYAVCRTLSAEQALARVQAGESYVVRLRSDGDESRRIKFDDMIKGTIEMPENDEDFVLLKSDGIPTYHFAHAVDDHLMHTTHVIRGDEWISSTPKHLQLFRLLGFKAPKYAHVSPLMKEDEGGGKRKISKRKDPEAAMHFFVQQGFPADSVNEYILTVANSDYEDWRRCNPDAPRSAFPFKLKKMSVSGALFDMDKLNDVSKNVIARMSAAEVAQAVRAWAGEYDKDFHALLARDPAFAERLFAIDRGGKKPRKDLARWSDARDYAAYFFDETFEPAFDLPEGLSPLDAAAICAAYPAVYDPERDQQGWFEDIKALCPSLGFCPETKVYKQNPADWKGHAGDVSTVLRIAVTGRRNTPDLCAIMKLLGRDRVLQRLATAAAHWTAQA